MKLWYRQAASQWVEALPVGNGSFGAMVHGGIEEELLQLNKDSLWSGEPYDTNNYDAVNHLADITRLVLEEHNYAEADMLALRMQGAYNQSYVALEWVLRNSSMSACKSSTKQRIIHEYYT